MLMAADIEVPRHVFVHGFLLGADGAQDEQVARQRARPVRGDRVATAPTRCATTCCATSPSARTAPSRSDGLRTPATTPSSPTSTATSRAARSTCSSATATAPCPRSRPTRRCAASSPGSSRASTSCSTAPSSRPALEEIWQRVRRLNRYVEERAPWALARDADARRRAGRSCSPRSPRACASSPSRCCPTCREDRRCCSRRSAPASGDRARVRGARAGAARVSRARAAVPEGQPRVIDSHTHLDACEPPDAELVAAADAAGVRADPDRRHRPGRAAARRSRAAERFPEVYAAIGCHPHNARASSTRSCCASSPRTRAAWRSARPASTTTATARRATRSGARSRRRSPSRTSSTSRS